MLLWRVDEFTRTTFPFNMGWGDHFPMGQWSYLLEIFDNRKSVLVGQSGNSNPYDLGIFGLQG